MADMTRRKLAIAGIALGCALFAKVTPASADAAPQAEILVIHATHCADKKTDPAIADVPGMGYECLKLLDTKSVSLVQGTPGTAQLPNGRTFQLAYNGKDGPKFKVTASMSTPDNKGFSKLADFSAEPNKKFHLGGFSYQGGTLILAIRIKP